MLNNLINKKFNNLTIISETIQRDAHGNQQCKCRCNCGKEKILTTCRVIKGEIKSCGCFRRRTGKISANFQGYEGISGTFWNSVKYNARKRGHPRKISIKYAWDLFLKQNRKCALSGLDLRFDDTRKVENCTASLDRIDSKKGYIKGNVQWVHKDINWMKQDYSQKEFINYCRLVSNQNKG